MGEVFWPPSSSTQRHHEAKVTSVCFSSRSFSPSCLYQNVTNFLHLSWQRQCIQASHHRQPCTVPHRLAKFPHKIPLTFILEITAGNYTQIKGAFVVLAEHLFLQNKLLTEQLQKRQSGPEMITAQTSDMYVNIQYTVI